MKLSLEEFSIKALYLIKGLIIIKVGYRLNFSSKDRKILKSQNKTKKQRKTLYSIY